MLTCFSSISSFSSSWVALGQSDRYFPSLSCLKKRKMRRTKSCRCHCCCYRSRLRRSCQNHCCQTTHLRSCSSHCCCRWSHWTSFLPSFPMDLLFLVQGACFAYFHFPSASSSSPLFLKVCEGTCVFQCIHKSSDQIPNTSGTAHFVCWPPLVFGQ